MSRLSSTVCAFSWPQPSVTVGNPLAVSQLASRPPLVSRTPGVRPTAAMARSARWRRPDRHRAA